MFVDLQSLIATTLYKLFRCISVTNAKLQLLGILRYVLAVRRNLGWDDKGGGSSLQLLGLAKSTGKQSSIFRRR
jgi:hypothetical protein